MTGKHDDYLCEYIGCSYSATEEVYARIGKQETITLNLCKKCAEIFRYAEKSLEKVSV